MGIAGVLGGLGGSQSGRRNQEKGMSYMNEGHQYALESLRRRLDAFNDSVSSGRYNPQKQFDLTTKAAERATKVGLSNIAARNGGFGYKNGDSNTQQDLRHFSEKAQLQLAQNYQDIQDKYERMQNQDLASLDQAANNFARYDQGLGQDIYGIGQRQESAANAGLISSLNSLAGVDWGRFKPPTK